MFNTDLFNEYLATSWLGRSFFFFEELESTSTYAKNTQEIRSTQGALVLTEKQLGGRGQHGHIWEAEPGSNLTFSLIFNPLKAERLIVLTLACAFALTKALDEYIGSPETKIKWPNDVYYGHQKIAGLLTEAVHTGNLLDRVVIGIGLNVNQTSFSDALSKKATSLKTICNRDFGREKLLADILTYIEHHYQKWVSYDLGMLKEVNRKLIGYGEWVHIEVEKNLLDEQVKFLGINENGALQVLNKGLEVNTFSYEQVRIKPG